MTEASTPQRNWRRTAGISNSCLRLPEAAEREGVASPPAGPLAGTGLAGKMTLGAETTVVLAGGGEATKLAVLVNRVADPVGTGIVADSSVGSINKNDLVVLVGRILVHPVRVEDAETTALATNALLGNAAEIAGGLELSDTLVNGLTVDNTLGNGPLTATTANANTVDNIALLGLVTKAASLVGAGRAGQTRDRGKLPVLPAPNAKKEAEDIALLLPPKLFNILISTHYEYLQVAKGCL
mmetsp:Transcript_18091/g.33028  ORF Transcript_18091/g.33028 Transcript_18091/m.33028 type:complete len:240 (+) Transcript_18091:193-912(+)